MIRFIILALTLSSSLSLSAQQAQPDTAFLSLSVANTKLLYSRTMNEQVQLYNGSDYKEYQPLKEEHPYYLSEDWIIGSVYYNGELFEGIPLLYNIYKDDVIAENFFGANMIQLIRARVKYFKMDGHTFVQLPSTTVISGGFYDLLLDEEVKVYAKRIKEFQETISNSEIQRDFKEKSKYFIYKQGSYYPVRSKRSLTNGVFSDKKREVNQFIHKNHLRFRKDRENTIVKVTDFYTKN